MNDGLKQRLVGAVVLFALAILFLPSLLRQQQPEPVNVNTQIPERPTLVPMTFNLPEAPEDVEPAPAPETMFMPEESTQPVVRELSETQTRTDAPDESGVPEPEPRVASERNDAEGAWVVQVASFGSADAANKLRDRLQEQGYKAYVRSATISSGAVSRVYIGPKLNRNAAMAVKAEVDQELRVESLVLRFQP